MVNFKPLWESFKYLQYDKNFLQQGLFLFFAFFFFILNVFELQIYSNTVLHHVTPSESRNLASTQRSLLFVETNKRLVRAGCQQLSDAKIY